MPAKPSKHQYENNPFFIATKGITSLFNLAQGVAVLYVVFSILGILFNSFSPDTSANAPSDVMSVFNGWGVDEWLMFSGVVAILLLAAIMVGSLFAGVSAYTTARIAQGDEASIRAAFHEAFDKLWSFIWLQIIVFVKVILWSCLFIIPGVIMAVRYSLANVVFFDETKNLRGNDAVKESLRLTKGGWITTFGSKTLFNVITLGAISPVISIGVNATLYQQFQKAGKKKPAAHWLSWLMLALSIDFLILIVVFLV